MQSYCTYVCEILWGLLAISQLSMMTTLVWPQTTFQQLPRMSIQYFTEKTFLLHHLFHHTGVVHTYNTIETPSRHSQEPTSWQRPMPWWILTIAIVVISTLQSVSFQPVTTCKLQVPCDFGSTCGLTVTFSPPMDAAGYNLIPPINNTDPKIFFLCISTLDQVLCASYHKRQQSLSLTLNSLVHSLQTLSDGPNHGTLGLFIIGDLINPTKPETALLHLSFYWFMPGWPMTTPLLLHQPSLTLPT